jgi:hypothetical protein
MRKSSSFLPDLIAAANHRGLNPRPAQVSAELSGLRYLGATFPQVPRPKPDFEGESEIDKRKQLEVRVAAIEKHLGIDKKIAA